MTKEELAKIRVRAEVLVTRGKVFDHEGLYHLVGIDVPNLLDEVERLQAIDKGAPMTDLGPYEGGNKHISI